MKIGIIGAGSIGANAARLFTEAGHDVAISNSRGPETLKELVSQLGSHAKAVTVPVAAKFGEVVLISIPFGKYKELPAEEFEGKIVIDSNNYYPQRDGHFFDLDQKITTSSELLAEHLSGARVVKGFNTIWFEHLLTQGDTSLPRENRRAIFIAGDNPQAKQVVSQLIDEIGFAAVDTGNLHEGGKSQQPGTAIYNNDLSAKEAEELLQAKHT
ncbi:MAG TPA: NAD(P)-binding domain-containing protein [Acidobacteriota bacterium]|nr:NAD(P)-binding domain-containing protein [Acidobacteriota bacterium]